jgi:hypothetical protein
VSGVDAKENTAVSLTLCFFFFVAAQEKHCAPARPRPFFFFFTSQTCLA